MERSVSPRCVSGGSVGIPEEGLRAETRGTEAVWLLQRCKEEASRLGLSSEAPLNPLCHSENPNCFTEYMIGKKSRINRFSKKLKGCTQICEVSLVTKYKLKDVHLVE